MRKSRFLSLVKRLKSPTSRSIAYTCEQILQINRQPGQLPARPQLTMASKYLADHCQMLRPEEQEIMREYLKGQAEISLNTETTALGNAALVVAPRRPGGPLELRALLGLGGKLNPQAAPLLANRFDYTGAPANTLKANALRREKSLNISVVAKQLTALINPLKPIIPLLLKPLLEIRPIPTPFKRSLTLRV